MQRSVSLRRRVAETITLMAVFAVIIGVIYSLLASYAGPLSGTYFDAVIATPFVLIVAFVVAFLLLARRHRSGRPKFPSVTDTSES